MHPVHPAGDIAQDQVIAARGDADVRQGHETFGLRQRIQPEGVLIEEADVHDVLAGLQHALHGSEAHEAGHRAHHQVGIAHSLPQGRNLRQIRPPDGHAPRSDAAEGRLRKIGHRDAELAVPGQIQRHCTAHATSTQNHHMLHGEPPGRDLDDGGYHGMLESWHDPARLFVS